MFLRDQGRDEEFDRLLRESANRRKAPKELLVEMAAQEYQLGNYEEAARWYRSALDKGLDTAYVLALQEKYPNLRILEDGR